MFDRARKFLSRSSDDLEAAAHRWLDAYNRHTHNNGHPGPNRPRIKVLRLPYREPTVHDRLGALADPEMKDWVDAYDAWKATSAAQWEAVQAAHKAENRLRRMPGATVQNRPREDDVEGFLRRLKQALKKKRMVDPHTGWLDMRFNPLACDEDFFIPMRAA